MGLMSKFTLIVNPGSASRKYALYKDTIKIASIHFETKGKQVFFSINNQDPQLAGISHITFASSILAKLLVNNNLITELNDIEVVVIRIVAPSDYFQEHRVLNSIARQNLQKLEETDPVHVSVTIQEICLLEKFIPHKKLIGISDSAFHATMPKYSQTYGIAQKDAKKFGIKRYGYHGLSVQSVIKQLHTHNSLPEKLIVCHLGGGSSITAVKNGKSIDTSMGYSPLEGLLMSTRSGNIDPTALDILQKGLKLTPAKLQDYLYHQCGLLGVSGKSSDIRDLLVYEKEKDEQSKLALQMYVNRIQQFIGQMSASLGGIDAIVFTGTIGERSATIRNRICKRLQFLGIELDKTLNKQKKVVTELIRISTSGAPVSIYIIPTDEMSQMLKLSTETL